jgi:hypothetical protein
MRCGHAQACSAGAGPAADGGDDNENLQDSHRRRLRDAAICSASMSIMSFNDVTNAAAISVGVSLAAAVERLEGGKTFDPKIEGANNVSRIRQDPTAQSFAASEDSAKESATGH